MFAYYFYMGLRSLRRHPVLTALMVMAIGIGVAASMTTYAVFRATSGDPIPQKSARLFNTQVDGWGPDSLKDGEPADELSYVDATAILRAHKAFRQAITYAIAVAVIPDDATKLPIREAAYATGADFFPMFDVPFIQGSGWTREDDERHANVAVISRSLNDQVFGGGQSVGRQVNLDGRSYRVVGVVEDWAPQPLFFDVTGTGGFGEGASVYIPFNRAIELKLNTMGNTQCNANPGDGWDLFLRSSCTWLSLWSELPTRADVENYQRYLEGYAADQQRSGRWRWPPNVRLRDVMAWLDVQKVVPPESIVSLIVSVTFLAICLVNTIGLLLAKFMRRAQEIGVRRALGASRRDIYAQFLVEAATVGLAGGVLGLVLTGVGVLSIGLVFPEPIAKLATIDPRLVVLTLLTAIVASVVAGFYPTWRASRVPPALQLKSN